MTPTRRKQIEFKVRLLQVQLWRRRGEPSDFDSIVAAFDPESVASDLGIDYRLVEEIAQSPSSIKDFKVAGLIDRESNRIEISKQFDTPVRRFTAAHELGHWVLHKNLDNLHRDRPLFGERYPYERATEELEADAFATFLLMPEKLVIAQFEKLFGTTQLVITEDIAFLIGAANTSELVSADPGSLVRCKAVATAETYERKRFNSLARQFAVSSTAMGIRLRELSLVV